MNWHDWTDEAFTSARELERPVLLFVEASWCRWCRQLDRDVLQDPRIADLLDKRFIAIRVDKDRRPDLDVRYSQGGWPTLAYLDDSGELLGADNYLDAPALLERLELVANYYAEKRGEIGGTIAGLKADSVAQENAPPKPLRRGEAPELSLDIVDHVAATIVRTADPVHGGWGERHKFPHPEAIDFALVRWSQTGDSEMLDLVRRTLRQMQNGAIWDEVDGGFYRYATAADWSAPHYEKMLDSNAQRLQAYLEAYQVLGDDTFKHTAEGCLRFLEETLLDTEHGVFRGSQDADSVYANKRSREERDQLETSPKIDSTIFTNWNAMAISALVKASAVLGEDRYRVLAENALEFLIEHMYDERKGIYHYWDGAPHLPGMISDHAYTLRALIDVTQYTGENRYLGIAERLANLSIELLRSEQGGFFDERYDPHARGGLRRRNRSILENSVMAEALLRLSHLLHSEDYADMAREALASFTADYKRYGHYVAGYARAVDLLFHEPVHVTVVGRRNSPETAELVAAALRPYVASRIVQRLDPALDSALLERFDLPFAKTSEVTTPRAYVHRGRGSYAETSDADRLPSLMARLGRDDG